MRKNCFPLLPPTIPPQATTYNWQNYADGSGMFPQSSITHPLNKGPVARRRCFPRTLARCSLSREGSVRVGGKNVHTTNQCTLQGAAAPTPSTAAYLFPQLATDVTEPLHTVEAHRLQPAVAQHFRDLCVLLLILLEDQFALLRLVLVLTATTVFTSLSLVLRHGYRAMWLVIASRKRTAGTKSSTEGGDFYTALLLRAGPWKVRKYWLSTEKGRRN